MAINPAVDPRDASIHAAGSALGTICFYVSDRIWRLDPDLCFSFMCFKVSSFVIDFANLCTAPTKRHVTGSTSETAENPPPGAVA